MATRRAAPRFQRRRYLVNPSLQYRFIGVLLLLLLLLTAGALGSVYLALWITLRTYHLADNPVAIAQLAGVGLLVTLQLLLIAPVVVWLGVRLTHKVAGPLVRIQAAIQQMTQGDYQVNIKLRKGDSLVELAESLNTLASTLRSRSS
ncbi:MAG: HAMP domain-containing protein [Candidatus Omnitrophica bacterium]|nr:HAMP domain-containing protein [Candidatus Omnitrophota bacterium]